jgi:hypothetical protein
MKEKTPLVPSGKVIKVLEHIGGFFSPARAEVKKSTKTAKAKG